MALELTFISEKNLAFVPNAWLFILKTIEWFNLFPLMKNAPPRPHRMLSYIDLCLYQDTPFNSAFNFHRCEYFPQWGRGARGSGERWKVRPPPANIELFPRACLRKVLFYCQKRSCVHPAQWFEMAQNGTCPSRRTPGTWRGGGDTGCQLSIAVFDSSGKGQGGAGGKTEKTLGDFAAEYAKSNRSTCKGCLERIDKVRIRLRYLTGFLPWVSLISQRKRRVRAECSLNTRAYK